MMRVAAIAALLVACRGQGEPANPGPADDAGADSPPTPTMGALAVSAYGCGRCHQAEDPADGVLSGQTTAVPGSQAYGSNLTPDPDTGMDAWEAGVIANAILEATDDLGHKLCPQMPAYADAGMSAEVATSIALYLQSLPAVWRPIPPSVCPPIKVAGDAGVP